MYQKTNLPNTANIWKKKSRLLVKLFLLVDCFKKKLFTEMIHSHICDVKKHTHLFFKKNQWMYPEVFIFWGIIINIPATTAAARTELQRRN